MQRPFNRNLKRFGIGLFRPGGGVPFKDNFNTWHKTVSGVDFAESINNLPAKFLPRVADFNGTDDLINLSSVINIGKIHTITINLQIRTATSTHALLGLLGSSTNFLSYNNIIRVNYFINGASNTFVYQLLPTDKELKIVRNGINVELFIDDVSKGAIVLSAPNNIDFTFSQIGARNSGLFTNGLISCIKVDSTDQTSFLMYPTGQGGFDYDLVSGTVYGTWSGTGTRFDYDSEGSTYPNTNGYSLWEHATSDPIQVPFDINGLPLSLTAGVDIPAGYTWTRDVIAGNDKHNIYDSLVDMEYGSLLQNDTAGIAYATQTDAYGLVLDVIVNKLGDTKTLNIDFISSFSDHVPNTNGYFIQLSSQEVLKIFKVTTAPTADILLETTSSYILINTDYRILIWRNETLNQFTTGAIGTFAVYIQGKNKPITTTEYLVPNTNEMELVNVSGGSGTNPVTDNTHTISNYLVTDLDAGDQASKIKVNGKYISPYDFTVSTGAYSIIDNPDNAIFNRTNATRQTATSRASLFYDANFPFRYHINEIADPRIYDTFFETAYQDRVFGKVLLDGTDIIRYDEQLNYDVQRTVGELPSVLSYCKISDIYP